MVGRGERSVANPGPRILAFTGHPVEAAGARHRVIQFVPQLERLGFRVDHHSFFSHAEYENLYAPGHAGAKLRALIAGTSRRALHLLGARRYDAILLHLWLHPIAFPPFDLLLRASGVPVVYDLDDPYYAESGSVADRFRDAEFIIRLMRSSRVVIAGSELIAEVARRHAPRVEILPTSIDTRRFVPRDPDAEPTPKPVIGWVGSRGTIGFLEPLYPVITRLSRTHDFVFRVVGGGRERRPSLPGVQLEWLDWSLDREVWNFSALDIGLYPLLDDAFSTSKHGFKLHQYMATGVPAVASASGLNPNLISHGVNGFLAEDEAQWFEALSLLLRDAPLRRRVGMAGRDYVEKHVSLDVCSKRLGDLLTDVVARRSAHAWH